MVNLPLHKEVDDVTFEQAYRSVDSKLKFKR